MPQLCKACLGELEQLPALHRANLEVRLLGQLAHEATRRTHVLELEVRKERAIGARECAVDIEREANRVSAATREIEPAQ
jgi:hypothetical protein